MAETILINFRVLSSRHPITAEAPGSEDPAVSAIRKLRPVVEKLSADTVRDEQAVFDTLSVVDEIITSGTPWTILSFVTTILDFVASNIAVTSTSSGLVTAKLVQYATVLLDREEPRLRLQVSDVLKSLSACIYTEESAVSSELFQAFTLHLAERVVHDWTRTECTREALLGSDSRVQMDDTTGWNKLESHLQALQSVVLGISGHSAAAAVRFVHAHSVSAPPRSPPTNAVQEGSEHAQDTYGTVVKESATIDLSALLISEASLHINRHVRENTFKFIAQLLSRPETNAGIPEAAYLMQGARAVQAVASGPSSSPVGTVSESAGAWVSTDGGLVADSIHAALLSGLQDDWSQIRHAAALACHSFLQALTAAGDDALARSALSRYWAGILPRLCMNRFYPAAAVQSVSQATWRSVLGPNALGRTLLAQHACAVVAYYCEMTRARNHMTSEAACQAIAEFAGRMDRAVVRPHVSLLLSTLCQCLRDDRWPVRDAAIIASGILVRHFADEAAVQQAIPELLRCWTENLRDFIWSIREHAAIAFGEALRCAEAGGQTASPEVRKVHENVRGAALSYVRRNLYYALDGERSAADQDYAEEVSAVTKAPKIKNFLPESLLRADAAAKRKQQQQASFPVEGIALTTEKAESAVPGPPDGADPGTSSAVSANDAPEDATAGKDRKGWGCCIDCIELRSCRPWEVSHGAVYLLREAARASPGMLDELAAVTIVADGDGDGSSQILRVPLLDALVRLLSRLTSCKPLAVDVEGASRVSQQAAGSEVSTEAERALLAAAVYEEIPAILASAVDAFVGDTTNRSEATDPSPAGLRWVSSDKGSCVQTLVACIISTLRGGLQASAAAASSVPARPVVSAGAGSVDAVARHSQHAARRSARNKDKLVVAAEKCVAALPAALTVQQRDAVVEGDGGNVDQRLRSEVLAMFPADLHGYLQSIM